MIGNKSIFPATSNLLDSKKFDPDCIFYNLNLIFLFQENKIFLKYSQNNIIKIRDGYF